ncbi:protein NipSnap homolog 3B-like [Tubulanus polymorphus]|uniref:protein NipSnap homolog 3B-like n=1 Tax=Tubulanus polymorphus TaxID=672921 RepID=UPI003DA691C5
MNLTSILSSFLTPVRVITNFKDSPKILLRIAATPIHGSSRRYSNASSSDQKIYELRQYTIISKDARKAIQAANENIHNRMKHSKCTGFWLSELGGLNEFIHIWEYESLAQRATVRKNLSEDPGFIGMTEKLFPYFQSMTNAVTVPMSWFPTIKEVTTSTGIYSMESWVVADSTHSYEGVEKYYKHVEANYDAQLVGALRTIFGPVVNSAILLWKYNNLDTAAKIQCDSFKDSRLKVTTGEYKVSSKVLSSMPFSPLK